MHPAVLLLLLEFCCPAVYRGGPGCEQVGCSLHPHCQVCGAAYCVYTLRQGVCRFSRVGSVVAGVGCWVAALAIMLLPTAISGWGQFGWDPGSGIACKDYREKDPLKGQCHLGKIFDML